MKNWRDAAEIFAKGIFILCMCVGWAYCNHMETVDKAIIIRAEKGLPK